MNDKDKKSDVVLLVFNINGISYQMLVRKEDLEKMKEIDNNTDMNDLFFPAIPADKKKKTHKLLN